MRAIGRSRHAIGRYRVIDQSHSASCQSRDTQIKNIFFIYLSITAIESDSNNSDGSCRLPDNLNSNENIFEGDNIIITVFLFLKIIDPTPSFFTNMEDCFIFYIKTESVSKKYFNYNKRASYIYYIKYSKGSCKPSG
jgi:hypothetical protein